MFETNSEMLKTKYDFSKAKKNRSLSKKGLFLELLKAKIGNRFGSIIKTRQTVILYIFSS